MTGLNNGSVATSYVYSSDGMRVSKSNSSGSNVYRYDGQMGMEDVEANGSGVWQKTTDYALGARGIEAISVTTGSGTQVSYPLYDVHGNMISTLTRAGNGGFAYSPLRTFDAWGNIRLGAQTGDPKGRYCANLGHKQDDESGLVYMRARYYEPGSGRFISEDMDRNDLNWFAYCGEDPVNFADGSGRIKFPLGGYEFRLDLQDGDLHVFRDGIELISKWANGSAKHKGIANEWTKDLVKTLVNAARAGDPNARGLLAKMKEMGGFGLDADMFKKGGIVGVAYTSVDAYAQQDPEGFFDIMSIIFTYGRGDDGN